MLESKEKVIDGVTFQVTPFPAFPALIMKARLAAVVVPVLGKAAPELMAIAKTGGENVDLGGIDVTKILPALEALATRLKPEEFAKLCFDLLAGTSAVVDADKGKAEKVSIVSEAAFNRVFDDRLATVYKAIWFVLETNDFFGFGGIMRALVAKAATVIKSRPSENSAQS